jgi:hypothetical protein
VIHQELFMKEAPRLHVYAMFAACGYPLSEINVMPIIAEVTQLYEELFGTNDDELSRVVIEYLAFRTAYTVGYENALMLAFGRLRPQNALQLRAEAGGPA